MATTDAVYSFPITEIVKSSPKTVHVTGLATDGSLDRDYQRVSEPWAREALREWLAEGGSLRQSHDPGKAIGKGVSIGADGLTVRSVVIDKQARKLTLAHVLRSYSIGISQPRITKDAKAPGGMIVGGVITELSLVDTPSNPSCGITLVKSAPDGRPEFVGTAWSRDRDTVTLSLPADIEVALAAADLAKLATPSLAKGKKKGKRTPPRALRKNHDFTCLTCGKTLDKGEKFCPECGRENPGYLPEADRKIPANEDVEKGSVAVKARSKRWRRKQVKKAADAGLLTKSARRRAADDFMPSIYDSDPVRAEAAWAIRRGDAEWKPLR